MHFCLQNAKIMTQIFVHTHFVTTTLTKIYLYQYEKYRKLLSYKNKTRSNTKG